MQVRYSTCITAHAFIWYFFPFLAFSYYLYWGVENSFPFLGSYICKSNWSVFLHYFIFIKVLHSLHIWHKIYQDTPLQCSDIFYMYSMILYLNVFVLISVICLLAVYRIRGLEQEYVDWKMYVCTHTDIYIILFCQRTISNFFLRPCWRLSPETTSSYLNKDQHLSRVSYRFTIAK